MADENKTKDPLGLEPNFFEKKQLEDEANFKKNFQQPGVNPGGMDVEQAATKPPLTEVEIAEEKEKEKKKKEEKIDEPDFEFDVTLAEAEKKELRELNEKLNTNFSTLEDLKDSLQKSDVSGKLAEIEKDQNFINYFEEVLLYNDKKLIFEDERLKAQQKGLDLNNKDVTDAIDLKIENLEEKDVISFAADSIRTKVNIALKDKKEKVSDFNNSQKLSKKEEEDKRKKDIQEGINTVYKQGKFLGIQPSKEDMLKIYQDISRNNHINHLRANPVDAVQFALFLKYKDTISKFFEKPSFNDGVKKVLQEIGIKPSEQTVKPGNTDDSDKEDLTYLEKFVQ